mgnify:CR=1
MALVLDLTAAEEAIVTNGAIEDGRLDGGERAHDREETGESHY